MNISIVIPNYNGSSLLSKNIPKLLEIFKDKAELIIVDDCSSDNSIDVLKKFDVKYLRNNKNLGFSSTVNKGVTLAKGEIVVLLNTDVWIERNFSDELKTKFKDKDIFAVGFLDKSLENGKAILRGRGIGEWKKGFLVHARGEVNKTNTLWANGGSAAFRKSIWKKLGGFDEIYNPFYWEDIDLSYRALKSGYKILFDPQIVVYHEHSKGAIKMNYSDEEIKTTAYRNQFIFAWKNGTDYLLQLNQFLFLPYHLTRAILRRDWAFLKGLFNALSILPEIVKSGLEVQELFVKSDREVIRQFKE